jgi:hypothetical protein
VQSKFSPVRGCDLGVLPVVVDKEEIWAALVPSKDVHGAVAHDGSRHECAAPGGVHLQTCSARLVHHKAVFGLLEQLEKERIFGRGKERNFGQGNRSLFGRTKKTCSKGGDRVRV